MSQTPPPGYPPPGPQSYPQPQPLSADEERLWSMLSHLSYFVLGIIAPLIIMLTLGTRSPYVRHHAVEALNFHITLWMAALIAGLSIFVLIGFVLLPAVLIFGAVFAIIAGVQSYQGVLYRYPLSIRLVT
jgi:uncharacterized Tic20 family protein